MSISSKKGQLSEKKPLKPKETLQSLSEKTGLSVFMLRIVADRYILKNESPRLSDITRINPEIASLSSEILKNARPVFEASQSNSKKKTTPTVINSSCSSSSSSNSSSSSSSGDESSNNSDDNSDSDDEDTIKKKKKKKKSPISKKKNSRKNMEEKKKKKKAVAVKEISDNDLRKWIVQQKTKDLSKISIKQAGSNNLSDSIPVRIRDTALRKLFVGYAKTERNYWVFVYFIGALNKSAESSDPNNWLIVHESHLPLFHASLRNPSQPINATTYYNHSAADQYFTNDDGTITLLYDPRYIASRWYKSQSSKKYLPLLHANKALFAADTGNLEDLSLSNRKRLHFYTEEEEEEEADDDDDDDEMAVVEEVEKRKDEVAVKPLLLTDILKESDVYVNTEEYPLLACKPLDSSFEFTKNDLVSIGLKLVEVPKMAPGLYRHDPALAIKAAITALNSDHLIKSTISRHCDRKDFIVESHDVTAILDYMLSDEEAVALIKNATANFIYSVIATELTTNTMFGNTREEVVAYDEKNGASSFVLQ